PYFKHPFKTCADHHLLVKLGALGKECPLTEEVHGEHLGSALGCAADYFRRMDLREPMIPEIAPERLFDFLLHPEHGTAFGRPQADGPVVKPGLERSPDLRLVDLEGQHVIADCPEYFY